MEMSEEEEKGSLTCVSEKKEEQGRETWKGQFEFTLTLIGYSIGMGNIWRFPYLCYRNGGGAFIIPYLLFLGLCGLPLLYMEICLGQFSGKSAVHVWAISPMFKGLGIVMVTLSAVYCWYVGLIMGWIYYYLIQSFYPTLGWSTCDNAWNTPNCKVLFQYHAGKSICVSCNFLSWFKDGKICVIFGGDASDGGSNRTSNSALYNVTTGTNSNVTNVTGVDFNVTDTNQTSYTAATEFWEHNVLGLSSGIDDLGHIQWHLYGCVVLGWVIVFFCLAKGVKTVGKVVYVTVLAPYVLLTVLLIRGITLNGAWDGVKLYLNPDFSRLGDSQIWQDAAVQVFYSLGPAWGGVITMSSFNKFHRNAFRDAAIVCFADAFTAIFAGLPVFAVLGYMAKETGKSLESFKSSGPGLVFIAYPEAISRLPLPQFWSVMFFLTLVFVGIDTMFTTFETVSATFVDMFNPKRMRKYKTPFVGLLITIMCVMSLPLVTSGGYYILMLVDWYIATFNVVMTAFIEIVVIAWVYGAGRFADDIHVMIGRRPSLLLRLVWVFGVPLFVGSIALMTCSSFSAPYYGKDGYVFPAYAVAIGNVIGFLPLCLIPLVALVQIIRHPGTITQRIRRLVRPSLEWVPNDPNVRELYEEKPYTYEKGLIPRFKKNVLGLPRTKQGSNGESYSLTTGE